MVLALHGETLCISIAPLVWRRIQYRRGRMRQHNKYFEVYTLENRHINKQVLSLYQYWRLVLASSFSVCFFFSCIPGLLLTQDEIGLYRLWFHECCRVFEDRLVNNEDRNWFEDLLKTKMTSELGVAVDDVLPRGLPIYGDFANPNSDAKNYEEITDMSKVGDVCLGCSSYRWAGEQYEKRPLFSLRRLELLAVCENVAHDCFPL